MVSHIEKLFRDFLWSGLGDKFKFHLIKWDKVCSPVISGGLSIKNIRFFNCALLGNGCGGTTWSQMLPLKKCGVGYSMEIGD